MKLKVSGWAPPLPLGSLLCQSHAQINMKVALERESRIKKKKITDQNLIVQMQAKGCTQVVVQYCFLDQILKHYF